jgi:hypothetical protein
MIGLYVASKNVRNLLQQSLRLPLTSLILFSMSVLVFVYVWSSIYYEIKYYDHKALYNKSDKCNNTQFASSLMACQSFCSSSPTYISVTRHYSALLAILSNRICSCLACLRLYIKLQDPLTTNIS